MSEAMAVIEDIREQVDTVFQNLGLGGTIPLASTYSLHLSMGDNFDNPIGYCKHP